ncbi:unnamed protein product [Brachionus calyciflorus]|uniref:Uncharacterized protein n=1 Tax=Brachionus calyciflorus TaxID=104777 RepID=A0A813UBY8_9BILA|nr:unnamed protein product [Brachionus calyciflorus]
MNTGNHFINQQLNDIINQYDNLYPLLTGDNFKMLPRDFYDRDYIVAYQNETKIEPVPKLEVPPVLNLNMPQVQLGEEKNKSLIQVKSEEIQSKSVSNQKEDFVEELKVFIKKRENRNLNNSLDSEVGPNKTNDKAETPNESS